MHPYRFCQPTILILACLLMMSCAINPVTGKREFVLMSESQEIAIGQQMDPKITDEYGGPYPNENLQRYVNQIGQKLASVSDRPELRYQFKVLDSPIINAFALPGGYVYITRGMLAYINSEAELAGVIGHEIGHITARHAVRQYTKAQTYQLGILSASIFYPEISQLGQFADFLAAAIMQGYGRNYELQSDYLGVKYTSAAEYDPYSVSSFMQTLNNIEEATGNKGYHGLFSSHPETEERIVKAAEEAKNVLSSSSHDHYKQLRQSYLTHIDGLVFGDDPKDGVVVENVFRHPGLRIELAFPKGWIVNNGKEVLSAAQPQAQHYIQVTLHSLNNKVVVEDFAKEVAKEYNLTALSGSLKNINGLSAYVGTYKGIQKQLGEIAVKMAAILVDTDGYILLCFCSPDKFGEALPHFTSTINSFNRLSQKEADQIKAHKIEIYTVKRGDSWLKLADKCGQSQTEGKTLALINAFDPSQFPQPGTKIKLVCVDDE